MAIGAMLSRLEIDPLLGLVGIAISTDNSIMALISLF